MTPDERNRTARAAYRNVQYALAGTKGLDPEKRLAELERFVATQIRNVTPAKDRKETNR